MSINALSMRAHLSTMPASLLSALSYLPRPTLIVHGDITLSVCGLAWEADDRVSDSVHACGFDSLVVNDSVTLESIEDLRVLAPCVHVGRILCMLDIQAQLDADQWANDARRLRHWLGRPC